MKHQPHIRNSHGARLVTALVVLGTFSGGCGPNYRELRIEGQTSMADRAYGPARRLLLQAEDKYPHQVENLYDLGACSLMIARRKLDERNHAAAMREVDAAVEFFGSALNVKPAHRASLEGLNNALELKGKYDEALERVEWAAEFVGPTASGFIYLANELEERGDHDGAYLRHRQSISIEPGNAEAYVEFAKFLLRNGHEDVAVKSLQAAYQINPLDPWVVNELASRGAVPVLSSGANKP